MEILKIKIPCEEVSKLVQEKAFEKGYFWGWSKKFIQFSEQPFLFLSYDGYIVYLEDDKEFFESHPSKEISWQEWVYGEGYFFMFKYDDRLFFQAKSNNEIYYVDNGVRSFRYYSYKQHMSYYGWYETDMFGNKLEEKPMKEEVKLYDDKISLELTAYQVATIKVLFGKMCSNPIDGIYSIGSKHFPKNGKRGFSSTKLDYTTTTSPEFIKEVESTLERNGYVKEAPKPVKEMSLADICKELGYDVKIIKE